SPIANQFPESDTKRRLRDCPRHSATLRENTVFRVSSTQPMSRSMTIAVQTWDDLADHALAGEVISRDDARAVLTAPDDVLLDQPAAAYRVRRHYYGNRFRLHFLWNAQSGLCPEDCHYCSQSAVSSADIDKYAFLAPETILAAADRAASLNVGTFCMVISGR